MPPADANVAVCILDSGVTQAHPLLALALDIADLHTINPAWGTADSATQWCGHGTAMAGTVLYGDLVPVLTDGAAIVLTHRLESVKILPPNGVANNEPDLYGAITAEAIARAEIQAPNRRRVIALAVTSESSIRGKPSSWSSTIDQLCFDPDNRRLLIVSAGNIRVDLMPADHLVRNDVESVEDPAHAWNALTVGAFTEKVDLTDPDLAGWTAIAPAGELSPRSRTSVTWERQWPVKPDVVFEGGNLASNGVLPGDPVDDLQLLTTHNRLNDRVFNTIGDTSAATALVARLAGSILATRPRLWPETVRALIVHSAEWTPPMRARINGCNGTKRNIHALVRRYGYGVPDLGRALMSAQNDLTLMVEDTLTPFNKEGSAPVKTRDMKVHQLPWPNDVLTQLGDAHVELRVTLSYFIEPNPGERGWTRRHRYASHGLRFAVKKATESLDDFRARVNDAARDEEEGEAAGGGAGGDEWLLGPKYRDQGSIHSDFWSGTAADLAQRDAIGVFPVGGWWKEKPYLEKWDTEARYSLIVTIKAPGVEVDIYTSVEAKIAIAAEIG
jgi:Subtilase family